MFYIGIKIKSEFDYDGGIKMFDTKVSTSYANGTIINLDANDALNFIVGLSITVINTVRDTIEDEDILGRKVTKSCDYDVMYLIEYYNAGVPEAIHSCVLQTNADILLKFVQDVVLNDTTRGLHLFYHNSRRNGKAPYDLVVKALDDIHQYYMKYGTEEYKRNKNNYFNRYNDEFMDLINRK